MKDRSPLLRSVWIVSALTLVSRVLGMIRDATISYFLGTGIQMDAYTVATRIPNMFRRFMGEGAMTAAFVPSFAHLLVKEKGGRAWRFASRFFWSLAVVLLVLVAAGVLFSPAVIHFFAPGFHESGGETACGLTVYEIAVLLNRIAFPYLLLVCLAAVLSGVLNATGSFAVPGATPILYNLTIIAAALLLARHVALPAVAIAVGFTLGGLFQLLLQVPFCRRAGMPFRPETGFRDPDVSGAARLMGTGIFGAGIYQINITVGTMVGSTLPEGSISALYYADRLNEFVLGGFVVSVATVFLPTLARFGAEGKTEEMRDTLAFGLRIVSFITIPSTVGLILLREGIVRAVYQRGRFDDTSLAMTAGALLFYSLGLVWIAAARVLTSAFFATKDLRTPALVAALVFGVNLLFMSWFYTPLGHRGIALASSLSQVVNALALGWLFRRFQGRMHGRSIRHSAVRIAVASLPLAMVCGGAVWWFGDSLGAGLRGIALLLGTIAAAAGAYFTGAWMLGCPEIREVAAVLQAKLRRTG